MPQRVDSLFWELDATVAPLITKLGLAQGKLAGFSRFVVGAAGPIAAAAALGLAFAAAGKKATDLSADLDVALREVGTLLPGTVADLGGLREQIISLSTRVPDPPVVLTRAIYQAVSAGARDTAEALQIVEVASKAAVGGLTDAFTATDAITTALNAYGLSAASAGRVSDILFATVREGKVVFNDVAQNIGAFATSASLAQVSLEEATAAFAALTKVGLSAPEAATSLNRLFLALVDPTDKERAAAKELGVAFDLVSVQARAAANGTGVLEQAIQDLREVTGGSITDTQALFNNVRSFRAAAPLAGEAFDDFVGALDSSRNSAGDAQTAYEEMIGSLQNQTRILKNTINARFLELGETTLPLVTKAITTLNAAIGAGATELDRLSASADRFENKGKLLEERFGFLRAIIGGVPGILLAGGDLRGAFPGLPGAGAGLGIGGSRPEELEALENIAPAIAEAANNAERLVIIQERVNTLSSIRNQFLREERDADAALAQQAIENRLDQIELIKEEERVRKKAAEEARRGIEVEERRAKAIGDSAAALERLNRAIQGGASRPALFRSDLERAEALQRVIEVLRPNLEESIARSIERGAADEAALRRLRNEVRALSLEGRSAAETLLRLTDIFLKFNRTAVEPFTEADLPESLREWIESLREFLGVTGKGADTADDLFRSIERGVRTVLDAAVAFGVLDRDAASSLNSLVNLVGGIEELSGAIEALNAGEGSLGSVLVAGTAVFGAAAAIGSAVFGESASDRAARESRERNRLALERLTSSVDRLAGIFESQAGEIVVGLRELAEFDPATLQEARAGAGFGGFAGFERAVLLVDDFVAEAERLGLSVGDLAEFAAAAGISIDELLTIIAGGSGDARVAAEEAIALANALDLAVEGARSFTSSLSALRAEFDIFDIEDPAERIRRTIDLLLEFTDLPADIEQRLRSADLTTAEGRALADKTLRELFLAARESDFFANLGGLSREQFIAALREIETALDEISETSREGTDLQGAAFRRTITEATGSQIAAVLTTIAILGSQRLELLQEILVALGGTVPPSTIGRGSLPGVSSDFGSDRVVELLTEIRDILAGGSPGLSAPNVGPGGHALEIVVVPTAPVSVTIDASRTSTDRVTSRELAEELAPELDRIFGERRRAVREAIGFRRLIGGQRVE